MVSTVETEKLEELIKEARKIGREILDFSGEFRIISHHDADGVAAAAIMVETLRREGRSFHLSFVKQLTGEKIQEFASEEPGKRFFIFTDLGSGQLENIQKNMLKR